MPIACPSSLYFASHGTLTLVGTSRGQVHIVQTADPRQEVCVIKMPGGASPMLHTP